MPGWVQVQLQAQSQEQTCGTLPMPCACAPPARKSNGSASTASPIPLPQRRFPHLRHWGRPKTIATNPKPVITKKGGSGVGGYSSATPTVRSRGVFGSNVVEAVEFWVYEAETGSLGPRA